jgi:hypothetical protein
MFGDVGQLDLIGTVRGEVAQHEAAETSGQGRFPAPGPLRTTLEATCCSVHSRWMQFADPVCPSRWTASAMNR